MPNGTAPNSRELAQLVRERIEGGEFPPELDGTPGILPPITQLMEQYGVARQTVRSAIAHLAAEGLVRTAGRKGTFVLTRTERRRIKRSQIVTRSTAGMYVFPAASYADEPWQTHGTPRASFEAAPAVVAERFGVDQGAEVLRRRRVMSPEGEPPFQIVDTWLSPRAVADAPRVAEKSTGQGGYLDRLEEAGHGPISWQEVTRVRMPSPEEAKLLEIPTSMPVMELILVGRSGRDNQPIEVTIRVIPGDRVELVADLIRDESAKWPRKERG
ncbi:GntR family transcriptional regulator [Streptomyces sp. ME19-01-6]|uniref:GntR family transcriptional regulator n=1 Tax=Streptomyces sp. ME19-01-6 TaxID=3028686 RepID=UPI0029BD335F|nr:GntR family transcriptional regulator [Streptomyces sp. ME19-01-6]MDX3232861.1 GntR family transcriptional regulator [Streptomyces sp. ME19-01-6]